MRRTLHLIHRWTGIAVAVLVLAWFVSGAVMLFVPFPKLADEARLSSLPPIRIDSPIVAPALAVAACAGENGRSGEAESLRLTTVGTRPAYHVLMAGRWCSVDAHSGTGIGRSEERAEIIDRAHRHAPFAAADAVVERIERDMWTVVGSYDAHRPLLRVETGRPDGLEIYLSSRTGEVVLSTQRNERVLNWAGAILHWIYITPLRASGEPWRQLILWTSGLALLATASGFVLGVDRLRLQGRSYANGRVLPYRGWKRWHHLLGLGSAVFIVLWLFSGWLSMHPFDWAKTGRPSAAEQQAFAGGELLPVGDAATLAALVERHPGVRELEWGRFDGRPFLRLRGPDGTLRVDAQGELLAPLSPSDIAGFARFAGRLKGAPLAGLAEQVREDTYFYGPQRVRTLPALRAELADAGRTAYYVDPRDGRLLMRVDESARTYRWLFAALHRLDFPPLGDVPWLRKLAVLFLSCLCAALCLSACVIGYRRLVRRSPPFR